MNGKEIILKAITCNGIGPKERLPVALLSGGTWTFKQKGFSLGDVLEQPRAAAVASIIEVNQMIQSDIVWPGSVRNNC
jgi:uroporphyrinogen decarboxylase